MAKIKSTRNSTNQLQEIQRDRTEDLGGILLQEGGHADIAPQRIAASLSCLTY